jgi:hypothetical protein
MTAGTRGGSVVRSDVLFGDLICSRTEDVSQQEAEQQGRSNKRQHYRELQAKRFAKLWCVDRGGQHSRQQERHDRSDPKKPSESSLTPVKEQQRRQSDKSLQYHDEHRQQDPSDILPRITRRDIAPVGPQDLIGGTQEQDAEEYRERKRKRDPPHELNQEPAEFSISHLGDSCRTLNVVARRRRTHRAKRTRELIRRCHPRRVRLFHVHGIDLTPCQSQVSAQPQHGDARCAGQEASAGLAGRT